ncbi:PEP-CTERM domain protein [Bradyrhizobium sp. Tv2a-2]|uniref:PEP-CTERM domain protein n=1 Tax=Bradyrhizobium sp. Tv2a-2 TaxID=113395 RepID=UPI0004634275|nr:PEP-CTERM domain protein [Bradyrhizobium sp. Tv2a-2]
MTDYVKRVVLVFATLLLFATASAKAAVFDINFTGAAFDLSVVVTSDSSDNLIAATGSVINLITSTTTQITGVVPLGINSDFNYDNLLFPDAPYVSSNGLLFSSSMPNFFYNIYTDGTSYWISATDPTGDITSPFYSPGDLGQLTVTAVSGVPEASTWIMMLLGFVAIAIGWKLRLKQGPVGYTAGFSPST